MFGGSIPASATGVLSWPVRFGTTWRYAFEELTKSKQEKNRLRWERAVKDEALKSILDLPIIETHAEHFLGVLSARTVSIL